MNLSDNQKDAIDKLSKYKVGALFMEQGTGKTRTAIELVNSTDCDYVLYIAPYRVIYPESSTSIKEEVEKWGGFNTEVDYLGVESLSNSDRLYLKYLNKLNKYKKPFVLVDESIKIKNNESKRSQRVLHLGEHSEYRLILNGTPITRDLLDLWSQMQFLHPKILDMGLNQFKNTFCKTKTVTKRVGNKTNSKEFITGYANIDYLHSLISEFVYHCDIRLNIDRLNHKINYKLCDESRERYNELKEYFLSNEMLDFRNNNIFIEMTQAMQHSYSSTKDKIDVVFKLLNEIGCENTIIFYKYVSSGEILKKKFPKCLVLSFQKSSLGLNLQKYNNTIYFDKVWDYYLMEQSKSRTYRVGQENTCNYYHLTGNVGLDKLIDININKKISMAEYLKYKTMKEIKEEL